MKLLLKVQTPSNSYENWIYDNISNELIKDTGEPIDLDSDERMQIFKEKKFIDRSNKYQNYKQKDITSLKIQLGMKCNMHCKYCAQQGRESKSHNPSDIPKFIELLKKSEIKPKHIELWGGEPLVYWKLLVVLLPSLHKLFPNTIISFITNGTLLDKSKIAFLKHYNVRLTFSHDAQGYALRGKDPLDDPNIVNLWRYAFSQLSCSINCVLTPANTDLNQIAEFFKNKLGDIRVHFEGPMTAIGSQENELMFSDSQLLAMQKSIFKELTTNNWEKFPNLGDICRSFITMLVQKKSIHEKKVKCVMNQIDQMAIDLDGNVLSCHDHVAPEGIVGNILELNKVNISPFYKNWNQREKCKKCLVLSLCKGSCPQMENIARTVTCKHEFAYYFAIFQTVFWLIWGVKLIEYSVLE